MTPSIEGRFANHSVRIETLEEAQKNQAAAHDRLAGKIDSLKIWIMGLLGTAVVELAIHGSSLVK